LNYAQARFYDQKQGRFISWDPILGILTIPESINPYSYSMNTPLNKTDKSGLWFGLDDAIAAGVGAVVGVVSQGVSDVVSGVVTGNWEMSSIETYVGAAVGGAAGGVSTLYVGPIAGAAIGSGTSTLVGQGLEKATGKVDRTWGEIGLNTGVSTFIGGVVGAIPFPEIKIPGINSGRNSFTAVYKSGMTKLANGTAGKMSAKVIAKGLSVSLIEEFGLAFLLSELADMGYDKFKEMFLDNPEDNDINIDEIDCVV
jgi:hypothetical protein